MEYGMSLANGAEVALRGLIAPFYLASRWLMPGQVSDGDEVPVPRGSLALAAKTLLDEVFFTSEMVSASLISAGDGARIRSEIIRAVQIFSARGWLDEPVRYHATPPPLSKPELRAAESQGSRYVHMRFESGYEPYPEEPGRDRWLANEANRTAHAWLLQHPDRPRPWLVCVHGYRMGVPMVDFLAFRALWMHHHLGLNVVMPILPLHGPRGIGRRSGDGFLSGDFLDTMHVQAQAMWDLRRVLSWIRAQDPAAVGVYGLSLGGYTAALLAALDADLDCVIAGIPATDFVRLARSHIPPFGMPVSSILRPVWDELQQLMRVVSPLALPPVVPWDRRYLFAGMSDRLVPADHVRDLWRHWDRPQLLWYEGGHVSFHWEPLVRQFVRAALAATGFTDNFKQRRVADVAPATA